MKIEIQIDEKIDETKVVIYTKEITPEINELFDKLSSKKTNVLKVYKNEEIYLLNCDDIESIYAEDGKIFAKTAKDLYQIKKRLYEIENEVPNEKFVRISNSEIINFDKVDNLNTKLLGTISINLKSGYTTYVSRRYIKSIKEFLGI